MLLARTKPPKTVKSGSGGGTRKSEYLLEPDPEAGSNGTAEAQDPEGVEDREVFNGPKRSKNKNTSEDDKFVEAFKTSLEGREKYETLLQDEDRLFMLSLVDILKKVPPQNKMATKIKIMMLLDEATRTETVHIPSPSTSVAQVSQQQPLSF
nr:unnamed protein product [Callosobruchus chinensis]